MIATYMERLPGINGDARLYSLDEPMDGADYLIVAVVNWPRWRLVETQVFPCDERGNPRTGPGRTLDVVIRIPPVEVAPVPPATKPTLIPLTHEEALALDEFGYSVAAPVEGGE